MQRISVPKSGLISSVHHGVICWTAEIHPEKHHTRCEHEKINTKPKKNLQNSEKLNRIIVKDLCILIFRNSLTFTLALT